MDVFARMFPGYDGMYSRIEAEIKNQRIAWARKVESDVEALMAANPGTDPHHILMTQQFGLPFGEYSIRLFTPDELLELSLSSSQL